MDIAPKLPLIEEIIKHHPASNAGIKRGWSNYIGGMADTGSWDRYKMLVEVTVEELQACLIELVLANVPSPPLSAEDKKKADTRTYHYINGREYWSNQLCDERFAQHFRDLENFMLWGIR